MVNPVTLHRDGIKGLDRAWGKPAQQTTGQIDLRGDVRELTTANCTRSSQRVERDTTSQ